MKFLATSLFIISSVFAAQAAETVRCTSQRSGIKTILELTKISEDRLVDVNFRYEWANEEGATETNEMVNTTSTVKQQIAKGVPGFDISLEENGMLPWTTYEIELPASPMPSTFEITVNEYDVHDDASFDHVLVCQTL